MAWHQKTQKSPWNASRQKKVNHTELSTHRRQQILVHSLDEALTVLEAQVAEPEERDVLTEVVTKFKEAISRVLPAMTGAEVDKVVSTIKDPTGLALRPKTNERDELLEVLMPLEEAPAEEEAMASIQGETPLDRDQRNLLRELFEDLKVAHEHTARACSILACLSLSLTAPQLMATLKAVTRPLIQVNTLEGLLDKIKTPKKLDLPEEIATRVQITMTLDPTSKSLQGEKINSPTQLLAASVAYKILGRFSGGTTQREMQNKYSVKAKQLAACLTGRKYLGGTDKKTSRKCRASGEEPPQPSKPTLQNFLLYYYIHLAGKKSAR